ncbi:lipase/acyltransferase domain-containing protein [Dactylosporangium sp. CA-139114]|uniref:lipase/acyltransferase domain-containing protein n=1 Tax=Dactylosporangium sp. CA-139114 TaxID=3239931 RepID=UPI003D98AE72
MAGVDPLAAAVHDGDRTHDAVVVIPGIMGSVLVDAATRKPLWSAGVAVAIAARHSAAEALAALRVRDGDPGGVEPAGLLKGPAWAPVIGGIEPYTALTRALGRVVADPAAVLEFAYDWRLSVEHNAGLLERAMHEHLERWWTHPAYQQARRLYADGDEGRLVLVAHSMGGLVVAALAARGSMDEVRRVITLGTPFHGSVKTLQILAHGEGTPLPFPRQALRELAATMPGLHDLLPTYRCIRTDDDVVALRPADVAGIGGDADLARRALERGARLPAVHLPEHACIAGIGQPTTVSAELRDGRVIPSPSGYRRHADGELVRDAIGRPLEFTFHGDGTVYRYAAGRADTPEIPVVQQHGALPYAPGALDLVLGRVTGSPDPGAVLGEEDVLGVELPDVATVGAPFTVRIIGKNDPARVVVSVRPAGGGPPVVADRRPRPDAAGDALSADVAVARPGLYRVTVTGGSDSVTGLVLVGAADAGSR